VRKVLTFWRDVVRVADMVVMGTTRRTKMATNEKVSAHTPGPWDVTGQADAARYIVVRAIRANGQPGRIIARVPFNKEGDGVYTDASDARLIAAAPDLLAACKALFADPHSVAGARLARAAIARASP
jgi:hypothetical protein